MSKKAAPTGREVPFAAREMFYSETNPQGIIRSSNEVFERVAGYPSGELIGKPHNIIRHPDMPRSLFSILWQNILANQPIAAFVKNLAANGDHYWVLAVVFPSCDGFVSIRIKATSQYLPMISKIYADTLPIEKQHGMERGAEFLVEQVRGLGFADYRLFTVAALNAELSSRSLSMKGNEEVFQAVSSVPAIDEIRIASQELSKNYEDVTRQIEPILDDQKRIEAAAETIKIGYKEIKFVAVNMMADVEHLGDEARTLSVIAQTFKSCSEDILQAINKLSEAVDFIKDTTGSASFIIASARMQVEMLAFYSTEIIHKMEQDPTFDPSSGLTLFARLCRDALEASKHHIGEMERTLHQATPWLDSLADATSALYFVRQNGRIEVARIDKGQGLFGPQLNAMNTFIIAAKREGKVIAQGLQDLNDRIVNLRDTIISIEHHLPE